MKKVMMPKWFIDNWLNRFGKKDDAIEILFDWIAQGEFNKVNNFAQAWVIKNASKIIDAIQNGYVVEELFYVFDAKGYLLLERYENNTCQATKTDCHLGILLETQDRVERFAFSKEEIMEYDPRFMFFAYDKDIVELELNKKLSAVEIAENTMEKSRNRWKLNDGNLLKGTLMLDNALDVEDMFNKNKDTNIN